MRFAFVTAATLSFLLPLLSVDAALVKRALTTCATFTNVQLTTPATATRPATNFGTISGCYCTGSNVTALATRRANRRRLRNARRAIAAVGATAVRNAIARIVRAQPGARTCNVPTHSEGQCSTQADVTSCRFSCVHGFVADSRIAPTNCDTCPGGRIACGNACGFFAGCPTNAPGARKARRDVPSSFDGLDDEWFTDRDYANPVDATGGAFDMDDDEEELPLEDTEDEIFGVKEPDFQPVDVRKAFGCEPGLTACGVFGGSKRGFECIDTKTDLESCGGCMIQLTSSTARGRDCSAIPGVSEVECSAGNCIIHSCNKGWHLALDGTTCKQDLFSNYTPVSPLGPSLFGVDSNSFSIQT